MGVIKHQRLEPIKSQYFDFESLKAFKAFSYKHSKGKGYEVLLVGLLRGPRLLSSNHQNDRPDPSIKKGGIINLPWMEVASHGGFENKLELIRSLR